MKSLVVEDEFTSRLVLQSLLARHGECHVAVSGEEAVHAFSTSLNTRSPYDLICMDIKMPGMGGIEAVKQIRATEENAGILSTNGVKILMATAVDDPGGVIQSFHALCDAFFVKPIDASILLAELRKLELIA